MAYKYLGKVIRAGRGWTDNSGTQHPGNWMQWSDDDKAAAGLVWEDDPPPFDSRYYWSAGVAKSLEDVAEVDENGDPVLDDDGNQVITRGLKSLAIAKVKEQAGALLAASDWMVVRGVELPGKPVPAATKAYRQAVRDKSDQMEAAISVCGTIDDIIMLNTTPVDENGEPTGNAPLADWPEMNDG